MIPLHLQRVLCVLGLLGGVPACNAVSASAPSNTADPASVGSSAPSSAGGSVLLYADASEAESSCGCGKIIRMVRQARDRGVAVREVSPDKPGDVAKRYRITVAPTVLVLDGKEEATARHEGESAAVVAALSADLERLVKQVRR
jgi:hypothetical protein